MRRETVVRCSSVSRRYALPGATPVSALERVDLELAPGEFLAVEGPSGSGKTTLLGLIAGIEPADSGHVVVLGHDLGRLTPGERARLRRARIGIVFQTFGLVPSLTIVDNVALPLDLSGWERPERHRRAREMLERVGLAGLAEARVDDLSGGERQRVGVARALVGGPELILADEPAGNLDDLNGRLVIDLLRNTSDNRGASVVLVTHDKAAAARADRRARLSHGRLEGGAPQ